MKVLLTGILGFVGSHLAAKMVDSGYDVYGVARRVANRNMDVIRDIAKDITIVSGDITDYVSMRNAIKTVIPDVVVHLAALSPVRDSFERPFEYQQANFVGTMNVAHALLELPDPQTRKMLAASTAEVYGIQENVPLKEDFFLHPSSPYAVTKAASDMYMQMMFGTFNLHGSVLRPTNSYGRKYDTSFMIEYLVTQMLKDQQVFIGAPDSVRDYMYIDDHVNAYMTAIKNPKADGEIYNAGTGTGITNRELALIIAKKIGYDASKIRFGAYPSGYPYRPLISDQPYLVLDAAKIKKDLNWTAQYNLNDGLDKTIAYFENKLAK